MRIRVIVAVAALLVSGSLALAVSYDWAGSGTAEWENQANWDSGDASPGDDGYPDDSGDYAYFPDGSSGFITTTSALTIYRLEGTGGSGSSFTIQLGGDFTVTDTTYERGIDMRQGTLDAHSGGDPHVTVAGSLFLYASGRYLATSGTTTIGNNTQTSLFRINYFRHNSGTVHKVGARSLYVTDFPVGDNAVYDLLVDDGWVYLWGDLDVRHDISGVASKKIILAGEGKKLTLGSSSHSSQVSVSLSGHSAVHTYVYAYDKSFPADINDLGPAGTHSFLGVQNVGHTGYHSDNQHIRWLNIHQQEDWVGIGETNTLDGECWFKHDVTDGTNTDANPNAFVIGTNNVTFESNVTINAGTWTVGSGTITLAGNAFTNKGTFVCGTGTVILTNNVTVNNNNQAFYDVTVNAGTGNTVTLEAGKISAISNLLHVVSGTCHTDDKIDKPATENGTWDRQSGGVNTIACGANPLIDVDAVLETGNPPPTGTVIMVR